ncbi:MAG: response regulator [Endomicrobia bacterium]|nr:response regulator [Endomicrobiia bacterium]
MSLKGGNIIESALIVSSSKKNTVFFTEILNAGSVNQIASLQSCAQARRFLLERDFDLVIVDAPLPDETGEDFSRHVAVKGISQVILAVNNEYFDGVCAVCENDGILTISKPVNKNVFWSALMLARSAQNKLKNKKNDNTKLKQKIEGIRIIDKAKSILMSYMNMSEQEAHRYIEKQAMDVRSAKKVVAEKIIKAFEN